MGFPGCHSPSRAEGHLVSCLTFSVALPRLDHRRSSTSVAHCFSFPSLRVVSENDSLADAHDAPQDSKLCFAKLSFDFVDSRGRELRACALLDPPPSLHLGSALPLPSRISGLATYAHIPLNQQNGLQARAPLERCSKGFHRGASHVSRRGCLRPGRQAPNPSCYPKRS